MRNIIYVLTNLNAGQTEPEPRNRQRLHRHWQTRPRTRKDAWQIVCGITNDANLWATETMGNPKYPLELFLRVITVSLETMKIVNGLPGLAAGTLEGPSFGLQNVPRIRASLRVH